MFVSAPLRVSVGRASLVRPLVDQLVLSPSLISFSPVPRAYGGGIRSLTTMVSTARPRLTRGTTEQSASRRVYLGASQELRKDKWVKQSASIQDIACKQSREIDYSA